MEGSSLQINNERIFFVPDVLRTDILYCQKALREHINMHQVLTSKYKSTDWRVIDIENEIRDIGNDQRTIIDLLRLKVERFFVRLEDLNEPIDRQETNKKIANQLLLRNCSKMEPIKVKQRLTEDELFDKYVFVKSVMPVIEIKDEPIEEPESAITSIVDLECLEKIDKVEQMEIEVSPLDINLIANTSPKPSQINNYKSQVSLLKPKSQRVVNLEAKIPSYSIPSIAANTQPPSSMPSAAVNNRRLNLLQALKKAKNEHKQAADAAAQRPIPPLVPTIIPKPQSALSKASNSQLKSTLKTQSTLLNSTSKVALTSVQSSKMDRQKTPSPPKTEQISSSSSSTVDSLELAEEEIESVILGKEAFLRLFGLCTHTYKEYLMSRRSERKRRNVTSTEKMDFHYGTFDIDRFERFSARNNKRPMLLATTATRSSRRTKESDEKPPMRRSSLPSASIAKEPVKLCRICNKVKDDDDEIIECLLCNKFYHKACNQSPYKLRNKYCLDCNRQKRFTRLSSTGDLDTSGQLDDKQKQYNLRQRQLLLCAKSQRCTAILANKQQKRNSLLSKNRRIKESIERLEMAIQFLTT